MGVFDVPYRNYAGATVTVRIKAEDSTGIACTYITFRPDDDPKNDETIIENFTNGRIQPGATEHWMDHTFDISFWKDHLGKYKITAGSYDINGNSMSMTMAAGFVNEAQTACAEYLAKIFGPEVGGMIQGFILGAGSKLYEQVSIFNPLTWGDLINGIKQIPDLVGKLWNNASMFLDLIKSMLLCYLPILDNMNPYCRVDMDFDWWIEVLEDAMNNLIGRSDSFDFRNSGVELRVGGKNGSENGSIPSRLKETLMEQFPDHAFGNGNQR